MTGSVFVILLWLVAVPAIFLLWFFALMFACQMLIMFGSFMVEFWKRQPDHDV